MNPRIILRNVILRPQGPIPMRRKARGREVAGMVYLCRLCGWESAPIKGAPNYAAAERHHVCTESRLEGADGRQLAMAGPRFPHRDTSEEVIR